MDVQEDDPQKNHKSKVVALLQIVPVVTSFIRFWKLVEMKII